MGWSTLLVIVLGSWEKYREGDPYGVVYGASHRAGQLGEI
jgi:hypothetical protein